MTNFPHNIRWISTKKKLFVSIRKAVKLMVTKKVNKIVNSNGHIILMKKKWAVANHLFMDVHSLIKFPYLEK